MNFVSLFKRTSKILIVITLLIVFGYVAFYLPFSGAYKEPEEFDGVVSDKWIGVRETEFGSRFSRFVMVESKDGESFKINLDTETYNRAELGMRIKRNAVGIIETSK